MEKIINDVPSWGLHDTSTALGWHLPAIRVGDFVFLSGFTGVDPVSLRLADTVEEQVRLIYRYIETALKAHGASLEDIVKTTIYFTDLSTQRPILDKVRREIFKKDPPVSTEVGTTALESGSALEIEATAVIVR